MKIEYDENKNKQNIAKHNISFEIAAYIFLDQDLYTFIDNKKDYGEKRYICIGTIDFISFQRVCVVVYTMRENKIRIISARRANEREQNAYKRRYNTAYK